MAWKLTKKPYAMQFPYLNKTASKAYKNPTAIAVGFSFIKFLFRLSKQPINKSCFGISIRPNIMSHTGIVCSLEFCTARRLYGVLHISCTAYGLSNARYNRTMDFVSGEIWSISLAILFALGKHIIAYPWLNAIDARKILFLQKQGIIDFLEKQGTLLLLPSSQKSIISKCCNNYICFKISPRRATVQYR